MRLPDLVPPAGGVDRASAQRPRDVVLVLDRSGSMEGWKMVAARRASARMIDTLNESDRFAVFAFDDRIETPPAGQHGLGLLAASDRNRWSAVEFLSKLESRGGTEIAQPLDRAVGLLAEPRAERDQSRARILVLVTDGQVGNEDQVLGALGARLAEIRVFTLGIDQAVNEGFLHRLAGVGAGGSTCELVESEKRLDAMMDSIHRRIGTPIVTDVRLEPKSVGLEVMGDTLVPDRPPCLFAGSPVLLLGRYRGHAVGPLEVLGKTTGGKAWRETVVANVRDNPAIASAWARGQVRQLEDRYAAGRSDRAALEQAIIATSLRYSVLCRFTAYAAVDRSAVVNEGGEVHRLVQPVEMPAGWGDPDKLEAACYMAPEHLMEAPLYARSLPKMAARFGASPKGFKMSRLDSSVHTEAGHVFQALPPSPSPPLSPDEELIRQAGFVLLGEISHDDHGTVYRANDRRGGLVFVRVLKNPFAVGGRAAFAKLQKDLKGLKHAAIIPIRQLIGDSRPEFVIAVVSQHIAGPNLTQWISRLGLPDPLSAARLVLALAEALEYGGRQLMNHGNLTPGNILIGDDGKPHLAGFGLVRLGCGPDVSCATVRVYVAPELLQSPGTPPTAQTDGYSLGVMFYRLLTGVLPDSDPGSGQFRPPRQVNTQVSAELESICLKAMAADPVSRYSTAGEFAADLHAPLGMKRPGLLGRMRR